MNYCKVCGKKLELTPEYDMCMECQGKQHQTFTLPINNNTVSNKTEMSKETYAGIKQEVDKISPLELLQKVMYGNRINGEVDQAYEELKHQIKNMNELIKHYSYLNENTNDYDLNPDEVDEIHNKIYEIEEELEWHQNKQLNF